MHKAVGCVCSPKWQALRCLLSLREDSSQQEPFWLKTHHRCPATGSYRTLGVKRPWIPGRHRAPEQGSCRTRGPSVVPDVRVLRRSLSLLARREVEDTSEEKQTLEVSLPRARCNIQKTSGTRISTGAPAEWLQWEAPKQQRLPAQGCAGCTDMLRCALQVPGKPPATQTGAGRSRLGESSGRRGREV